MNEIKQKYKEYDVISFIRFLIKKGFVKRINGREVIYPTDRGIYFGWSKKIINRFTILFITIIIIFGLFIFIKSPPKPQDFFVFNDFRTVILYFGITFLTSLIHEFSHLIVANYYGVRGKIEITDYFLFLAFITKTNNLWSLNRKKRFFVHVAGIVTDLFILSVSMILSELLHNKIFRMVALKEMFALISQLYIHLRTDLYFIIEDLLDAHNLKQESFLLLKSFLTRKKVSLFNNINHLLIFLIIALLGYTFNILIFATYYIKILLGFKRFNKPNLLISLIFLFIVITLKLKRIFKNKLMHKKILTTS